MVQGVKKLECSRARRSLAESCMRIHDTCGSTDGSRGAMSRLNPRRHACFSRGVCLYITTSLCTATTIHSTHELGAVLEPPQPAWVDQHTCGSRLIPTVFRCLKGMAVGGSSQQHSGSLQYSAETRQTFLVHSF